MAYSQDYIFRNKHHGESIASSDAAGFDAKVITENNKVVIDENGLKITHLRFYIIQLSQASPSK